VTQVATLIFALVASAVFALAQDAQDYQVYTESPRLLLNARRLRLLKRERERQSLRWTQFDTLMSGKARMPEPAFAAALYGVVTDKADACREAGDWSLRSKLETPADLRQAALAYDWCGGKLPDSVAGPLAAKLATAANLPAAGIAAVRSRLFAALAIADDEPKLSETVAKETVETWWKRGLLPKLSTAVQPVRRPGDLYALMEMIHVLRDNLRIELKDDAPRYFSELPPFQLLTYYPQPWPAAENEYRIPMYTGNGDPVLEDAALSRASEMALIAYDGNPQPVQFLQGWIMQDRFLMRGPFGIPYEFLWGNPYMPGLSYQYMPDLFHARGVLLVRANWDEDSAWFACIGGQMQYFNEGKRVSVNPAQMIAPLNVGDVTIHFWRDGMRFEAGTLPVPSGEDQKKTNVELAFIVGAKPRSAYDVEVDGEEMYEAQSDEGGIIALQFQRGRKTGVRIKPAMAASIRLK